MALIQPLGQAEDARAAGVRLYRENHFSEAIPQLKKALESNPDDKEVAQLLGIAYYLTGQDRAAVPLLERAQSWVAAANTDASYILGMSYIRMREYEKALQAFAGLFHVDSQSAASHLFLARMLLRQEMDLAAEEYARKAIAIDPRLPLANFLLGEIHLFKSRVSEAIECYKRELELNAAYAPAYYKLGDAYSRLSQWEEAERNLQRSVWLDASSTGPYVLLGKVHLKKGEAELASRFLARALSMDPNNFLAHNLLGQAYRALGRNEEADREMKKADELQKKQ